MKRLASVAGALTLLLSGCTGTPAVTPGTSGPSASPTESPSNTPTPTPTTPTARECAARIVDGMSRDERIGQLVMVGVTSGSSSELRTLRTLRIGSVIIMGTHGNGVRGVRRLTDKLTWPGQRTPIVVAVDQEGGLVQRLKGSGFDTIPSAAAQARWKDATLAANAQRWGRQMRSAGVHWTLAPVADVVPADMTRKNAPIGALGRGYGSDPKQVANKVTAFVEGMAAAKLATSVKHFPGIGRVVGNTDFTAGVTDTKTRADDPYLQSFQAAVTAGVPSVMVSTVTYSRIDAKQPAVFSPRVIGLIRDKLGFDGVVISDDLGAARSMAAVPARTRAIDFITAGGDVAITVTPSAAAAFVTGIRAAAGDPEVADRIAESATRVVELKIGLGLLPCR